MIIKNNKSISLIIAFIIVGALAFQSCVKDNFEFEKMTSIEWNPNLAVPLVHSSFTLADILELDKDGVTRGFLEVEVDQSLTVIYNSSVVTGNATATFTDSIKLTIFGTSESIGVFEFENPEVILTSSNSFGFPIIANITQLNGRRGNNTFQLPTSVPFVMPVNTPNAAEKGQSITAQEIFDKNNSNAVSVFNEKPRYLTYTVDFAPDDTLTNTPLFYLDTAKVELDVLVKFPLEGKTSLFTFYDTVPDIEITETLGEEVESGLFRIYTSNGFPLNVDVQVYFVDASYNILDSLFFIPNILGAGKIKGVGVVEPKETIKDIVLDEIKLNALKNTQNLIVKAVASSPDGGVTNVKLYNDYLIELKFGLQAKLALEL